MDTHSKLSLRTVSLQARERGNEGMKGALSVPLTHLKSEHLPPVDARSCGILGLQRNQKKTMRVAEQRIRSRLIGHEAGRSVESCQREIERVAGRNAPLLDPAGGGARRAADRLRLRVLRRVVVLVASRSGGGRRVLHRHPSLLPCASMALAPPRVSPFSLAGCGCGCGCGWVGVGAAWSVWLGRSVGRSESELTFARRFNGGRRRIFLSSSLPSHRYESSVVVQSQSKKRKKNR